MGNAIKMVRFNKDKIIYILLLLSINFLILKESFLLGFKGFYKNSRIDKWGLSLRMREILEIVYNSLEIVSIFITFYIFFVLFIQRYELENYNILVKFVNLIMLIIIVYRILDYELIFSN